jgi:hypothetical protein
MKNKENYTIDSELSDWIRKKSSGLGIPASVLVNGLIREGYSKDQDFAAQLEKLNREELENKRKQDEILNKIQVQLEEGDKKEREEADKIQKKQEAKEEKAEKKLKILIHQLKKAGYFKELCACKSLNEVFKLEKKLQEDNFCMDNCKLPGVGLTLLKEILDYDNIHLKWGPMEKEEASDKLEEKS